MLRISVRKSCRNLSFCQRNTRFAFFLILLNLQSDFTESTVCFYRIYNLFLQNLQSVFTESTICFYRTYSPHHRSLHLSASSFSAPHIPSGDKCCCRRDGYPTRFTHRLSAVCKKHGTKLCQLAEKSYFCKRARSTAGKRPTTLRL